MELINNSRMEPIDVLEVIRTDEEEFIVELNQDYDNEPGIEIDSEDVISDEPDYIHSGNENPEPVTLLQNLNRNCVKNPEVYYTNDVKGVTDFSNVHSESISREGDQVQEYCDDDSMDGLKNVKIENVRSECVDAETDSQSTSPNLFSSSTEFEKSSSKHTEYPQSNIIIIDEKPSNNEFAVMLICKYCKQLFPTHKDLYHHMMLHSNCSLHQPATLQEPKSPINRSYMLQCKFCTQLFPSYQALYTHATKHANLGSNSSIENQYFTTVKNVNEGTQASKATTITKSHDKKPHIKKHNSQKKHKANVQDDAIQVTENEGSIRFKKKDMPLAVENKKCNKCEKMFLKDYQYMMHTKYCKGKKHEMALCFQCNKLVPAEEEYEHALNFHDVVCPICGLNQMQESRLKSHMKYFHNINDYGKENGTKRSDLRGVHIVKHLFFKKCGHCGKVCESHAEFTTHTKEHRKKPVKPENVEEEDIHLNDKTKLNCSNEHEEVDSTEDKKKRRNQAKENTTFKCESCDKHFFQEYQLTSHVKRCSGKKVKTTLCQICDCLIPLDESSSHYLSHVHICPDCGKEIVGEKRLKRHICINKKQDISKMSAGDIGKIIGENNAKYIIKTEEEKDAMKIQEENKIEKMQNKTIDHYGSDLGNSKNYNHRPGDNQMHSFQDAFITSRIFEKEEKLFTEKPVEIQTTKFETSNSNILKKDDAKKESGLLANMHSKHGEGKVNTNIESEKGNRKEEDSTMSDTSRLPKYRGGYRKKRRKGYGTNESIFVNKKKLGNKILGTEKASVDDSNMVKTYRVPKQKGGRKKKGQRWHKVGNKFGANKTQRSDETVIKESSTEQTTAEKSIKDVNTNKPSVPSVLQGKFKATKNFSYFHCYGDVDIDTPADELLLETKPLKTSQNGVVILKEIKKVEKHCPLVSAEEENMNVDPETKVHDEKKISKWRKIYPKRPCSFSLNEKPWFCSKRVEPREAVKSEKEDKESGHNMEREPTVVKDEAGRLRKRKQCFSDIKVDEPKVEYDLEKRITEIIQENTVALYEKPNTSIKSQSAHNFYNIEDWFMNQSKKINPEQCTVCRHCGKQCITKEEGLKHILTDHANMKATKTIRMAMGLQTMTF